MEDLNARVGLDFDARIGLTGWRGEQMDYGSAVDGLLSMRSRGRSPAWLETIMRESNNRQSVL